MYSPDFPFLTFPVININECNCLYFYFFCVLFLTLDSFFVSRLCCVLIVSSGIRVSICLVMLVALLQAEGNFSCFGICTKVVVVHVYFCQCLVCVVSDLEKSTF